MLWTAFPHLPASPPGGGCCLPGIYGYGCFFPLSRRTTGSKERSQEKKMGNASCAQACRLCARGIGLLRCPRHKSRHLLGRLYDGSSRQLGECVWYLEFSLVSWVWKLGQKTPREQAFWKFLLPAMPGITEALPAKCAGLLHLEPATTWVCEGAKMWKVMKGGKKRTFWNSEMFCFMSDLT